MAGLMERVLVRRLGAARTDALTSYRRTRPSVPAQRGSGVRRRKSSHLAACVRLLAIVNGQGQYPVYWPDDPYAWLQADDVLSAWVLERDGKLLGHVAVVRVDQDPVMALRWREVTGRDPAVLAGVSQLFVRPGHSRKGIGGTLLDHAVADIRGRGMVPVLDVVSASADAIGLYEKRGWRLLATYPWGRPGDTLKLHYYAAP